MDIKVYSSKRKSSISFLVLELHKNSKTAIRTSNSHIMEKKLAAVLGKSFKTSKFKTLTNCAISRIAYLEKQHKTRCFQARADVVQLLNTGQRERALLRVEHVIREQNMLDAYAMIENFLHLLMERLTILENNKKCPDELKEAISSLIFAASRCGELPEMQKIRSLFESRFGKEFATRAVELRNNCGVNPKIAKKLATRLPSLDSKLKALNEIAPANDISLLLERKASAVSEKLDVNKKIKQPKYIQSASSGDPDTQEDVQDLSMKLKQDESFSKTTKERKKYRDAEAAARAAFKFATHAAAAARAAIELSGFGENLERQNSSIQERYVFDFDESMISKLHVDQDAASKENKKKHGHGFLEIGKIQANDILKSKARSERITNNKVMGHLTESDETNEKADMKRVFVENDDDSIRKQNEIRLTERGRFDSDGDDSPRSNGSLRSRKPDEVAERDLSHENKDKTKFQVLKENLLKQEDSINRIGSHDKDYAEKMISRNSKVGRRPISMRTRRMHRQ